MSVRMSVDMPWKGLDRAITGGCSNDEIRAMFPDFELPDEWLEERRKLVSETGEPDGAAEAGDAAFRTPEYLMRMENAIGILAETIDNADDLYRLAEAAQIVAEAKRTEWEIRAR